MNILSINNNNNNTTRFIGNNKNSMERQDIYTNDNNPTASSCTTENGGGGSESPNSSAVFSDFGISKINTVAATSSSSSLSLSSPKKSGSGRRSVQKRVVSIPIKEVEGSSRLKGESCHVSTPPSDSWAWRKYGQKPIKGSPYPRGYYRCSSSKGCPARKQVERSRVDPTMLLVTYSAEHNHPWPVSSRSTHNNNAHKHHQSPPPVSSPPEKPVKEDEEIPDQEEADQPGPAEPDRDAAEERFPLVAGDDQFGWFGAHMDTATLESPIFADGGGVGGGGGACESLAAVFPMGEEDESLFADLGELPECSLVFRHRGAGPQVEIC